MIKKALLAATVASGLIIPQVAAGVYLPPKPSIIKPENIEFSKHMLAMPITLGMLPGKTISAVIAASATGIVGTAVTSHTVPLPSGIVSGNLLIAIAAGADRTWTWPAGWTELTDDLNGATSSLSIAYRTANGTEGASITATSSLGTDAAYCSVRITGAVSTPVASTLATGATAAPDGTSVNAGTGRLFLSIIGGQSFTGKSVTSVPSGYTSVVTSAAANNLAAIASLASAAASSDPGAWALSGTLSWLARTVAV